MLFRLGPNLSLIDKFTQSEPDFVLPELRQIDLRLSALRGGGFLIEKIFKNFA